MHMHPRSFGSRALATGRTAAAAGREMPWIVVTNLGTKYFRIVYLTQGEDTPVFQAHREEVRGEITKRTVSGLAVIVVLPKGAEV